MSTVKTHAIMLADEIAHELEIDPDLAMDFVLGEDPTAEYLTRLAQAQRADEARSEVAARMMSARCSKQISNVEHPSKRGYRLVTQCTLMRDHQGNCGQHPLLAAARESQ